MSAERGIRVFGQDAIDAVLSEFTQLNNQSVFGTIDAYTLSKQQKQEALRAINLIKQKQCGKIKGRTCTDGRKQRGLYTRDQTASPTVSLEAFFLSLMIDVAEERKIVTADVPGAYLHADMDEFVIIWLTGNIVDIVCKINPTFLKSVVIEFGKNVLYMQLLKALYSCVRSALLWYELYLTVFKDMGFVINLYNNCLANKIINGKQCTVIWNVDDNKINHATNFFRQK